MKAGWYPIKGSSDSQTGQRGGEGKVPVLVGPLGWVCPRIQPQAVSSQFPARPGPVGVGESGPNTRWQAKRALRESLSLEEEEEEEEADRENSWRRRERPKSKRSKSPRGTTALRTRSLRTPGGIQVESQVASVHWIYRV